jgi:hypothetical protein
VEDGTPSVSSSERMGTRVIACTFSCARGNRAVHGEDSRGEPLKWRQCGRYRRMRRVLLLGIPNSPSLKTYACDVGG